MSGDNIQNVLHETRSFPPPADFTRQAHISSEAQYQQMWNQAKDDPATFWGELAQNLHWFKKWDHVTQGAMPDTKWFVGGKIVSVAAGCDTSGLLAKKLSEKVAKTIDTEAVDVQKKVVEAKK